VESNIEKPRQEKINNVINNLKNNNADGENNVAEEIPKKGDVEMRRKMKDTEL